MTVQQFLVPTWLPQAGTCCRVLRLFVMLLLVYVLADLGEGMAAEASASGPRIRNVLLIVSDDLRASVLGCYGDSVCQTPHLDRLARQGLVFDRAYCQGTVCGPSRQSFMFSRYRGRGHINLGQHLIRHGFHSARVGKIFHMRVPGDIIAGTNGLDEPSCWTERYNSSGKEAHTPGEYACLNQNVFTAALDGRQTTRMPHRMFVSVHYAGNGSDQPDHKSASKSIQLLRRQASELSESTAEDRGFLLAVGLVRPHYPMVQPYQFAAPYPWQQMQVPDYPADDLKNIPRAGVAKTNNRNNAIGKYPQNQQRMWAAYYASVSFMDQQVGRIMAELDRLGLRESTAVVFTSDHGYHLGDHGFWQKANLHEQVVRVPLIISAPGLSRGRTQAMAELVDLFPTICELTGTPVPDGLHGRSQLSVLRQPESAVRQDAYSWNSQGHSLRTPRWHYIRYRNGTRELYDMSSDPEQFTNLVGDAEFAAVADGLDGVLRRRIRLAVGAK